MLFTIYEVRVQLISTILVGFGRAIAEVGAVQMVGGNIQFKTRIMTTAIMMQTNMGNFEFAVALGIVLLVIAFLINSIVNRIQESTSK
jgi:tungstate transport system permease protein